MWIKKKKMCRLMKVKFNYKANSASGIVTCPSGLSGRKCLKFRKKVKLSTIKVSSSVTSASDCYSLAKSTSNADYWNYSEKTDKCYIMQIKFGFNLAMVSGGKKC